MELGFIIASVLLLLFAVLALFDGVYLHIFKYRLQDHPESHSEHLAHTARAVLFPGILFYLMLSENSSWAFVLGLALVLVDLLVLAADAWMEHDSRKFMGGLPRWEYILHLMVNGFHFASISVFLVLKIRLTDAGLEIVQNFADYHNAAWFRWLVINLLPGAILVACLHIAVVFPPTSTVWRRFRAKITCC